MVELDTLTSTYMSRRVENDDCLSALTSEILVHAVNTEMNDILLIFRAATCQNLYAKPNAECRKSTNDDKYPDSGERYKNTEGSHCTMYKRKAIDQNPILPHTANI